MKVLITGGYGFIGSFVAEKFSKEGYEISIIDDLSAGSKRNVTCKHKSYLLSVEDRKCEAIFRRTRYDAVIHLAAQINVQASLDAPMLDTKTNVLGLSNMLELSHKYGASKFIFASSAAVYGLNHSVPLSEAAICDPISPYGLNKWVGETYCRKWREMYGLETLCFRFSNVYGPRQGSAGEGGVVSIFTEAAINGKELTVFGDGTQTRDFIYVGDVAETIYRASRSELTGVYNLSTMTETSVNGLIDALRRLHGPVKVAYKEKRAGDIERSALDNTRLGNAFDWAPRVTLEEGLTKTYEWFTHEKNSAGMWISEC